MSLKQLTANRLNARKSTGPQTTNGKAVAKMNAVKHGILSREVVVRGLHIQESQGEYAALHRRFVEELEPVGPVEEMLVDQIVTAHWRLRRALTAESGEIALSVDQGQWERATQHPFLEFAHWEAHGDPDYSMGNSVLGNFIQEKQLRAVRASVETEGELTDAAIQSVAFRGQPYGLTRDLKALRSRLEANPGGLEAAALRARQKEQALAFIDQKLEFISWRKPECEERERKEERARQSAAVLPSLDVLEKIMRYETKLERQIYRALAQLERLQRMRKGETLPAPLAVISDRL